jgi:hypothetical protein
VGQPPASPFYLPPVQPAAGDATPTNSFLSFLAQSGPPPAPPPVAPPASNQPGKPLGISGSRLAFRCGPYDSFQAGHEAVVELSLYLDGRDVDLPVCIKVVRVESMPDGTRVCWCMVLEDEQKIKILNQLVGTPGDPSFLD